MGSVVRNLGISAVVLVALFGLAVVAGRLLDPDAPEGDAAADHSNRHPKEMENMTSDHVRGLAVAENGLRLVTEDPEVRRGAAEELRFRIVDRKGPRRPRLRRRPHQAHARDRRTPGPDRVPASACGDRA
jgi:hypothetical protein